MEFIYVDDSVVKSRGCIPVLLTSIIFFPWLGTIVPGKGVEKLPNNGIVVGGFTYHQNTTKEDSNMRYLVCSEYKRLVCKARAVLPVGGSIEDLILRKEHNHPPLLDASVRDNFIREIKHSIVEQPNKPLRLIYEDVCAVYLGCAEHKRSGCRARAMIPVDGLIHELKVTQPHNHPPDLNAEEKDAFIKELKAGVRSVSMENATLKKVYDTIAEVFPKGAKEIPFKSICSSLHRWRKNHEL